MIRSVTTLFLLITALPSIANEWIYTVRPGDEVWNIAAKYCGSAKFAERIIQYNKVGNERVMRPGKRLRIPIEWLVKQPASVEIIKLKGTATVYSPEPSAAVLGQRIQMGSRLATEDGTVLVEFADGSTMNVAPQSEVLFNVLTAYGDTGMVDTHLRFYRGRATSKIIRRADASRFRISSPLGTAAVRGTEFRVAIEDDASITETLEGSVGFIQTTETPINQGYGAVASAAGVETEVLLPVPSWISSGGLTAPDTPQAWAALADAVAYRLTVFAAAERDTPISQQLLDAPQWTPARLQPGVYVVNVRGVSARGIEGYDAELNIQVASAAPNPAIEDSFDQYAVALRWQASGTQPPYTVQVSTAESFDPLLAEFVSPSAEVAPEFEPGKYFWRVRDSSSVFSTRQPITVRPLAPKDLLAQGERRTAELSWSAVEGAGEYRVVVSRDTDFATSLVDQRVPGTRFTHQLSQAGTYFVQVYAITNGVESLPAATELRLHPNRWWYLLFLSPILI